MNSLTLFFFFIPFLALILIILNIILAPHKPYNEKASAFECGFHSFLGQNRSQFSVSFFLFGLLFLIFDLEIVLIFPYAVSSNNNLSYGLTIVFIFIVILTAGFIFEIGKKALTINSRQSTNIPIGINLILSSKYQLIKFINIALNINLLRNNQKLINYKSDQKNKFLMKFINKFLLKFLIIYSIGICIRFLILIIFGVNVFKNLNNIITILYYPFMSILAAFISHIINRSTASWWKMYLFSLFLVILAILTLLNYNSIFIPNDYDATYCFTCFSNKHYLMILNYSIVGLDRTSRNILLFRSYCYYIHKPSNILLFRSYRVLHRSKSRINNKNTTLILSSFNFSSCYKIRNIILIKHFSTSLVLYMDSLDSGSDQDTDMSSSSEEYVDWTDVSNSELELFRNYIDIICEKHGIPPFPSSCFRFISFDEYPDEEKYVKWIKVIRKTQKDILSILKNHVKEWEVENEHYEDLLIRAPHNLDAQRASLEEKGDIELSISKVLKFLEIIDSNKNNIESAEMGLFIADYNKETNFEYYDTIVKAALFGIGLLAMLGLALHEPSNLDNWHNL